MNEMSDSQARAWLDKAETLREALPFMRRYTGKTIVVKFGGHAMVDPALTESFAADIALLRQVGMRPIVVHGGGPQIAQGPDQRLDRDHQNDDDRETHDGDDDGGKIGGGHRSQSTTEPGPFTPAPSSGSASFSVVECPGHHSRRRASRPWDEGE